MCMEDIRTMRKTGARSYQATAGATFGQFIPQDDDRVSLVIGSDVAAVLTLSLRGDAGQTAGIIIPVGASPFTLDIQKHGWLVCSEIQVKASAGNPVVTAWGSILSER